MTKTELLEKIREQFLVFKNDNRALPKYKGLPDMLDAMIEVLDGSVGSEDLTEIKNQVQDLRNRLDSLEPGLSDTEVQAKIDEALRRIDDELAAINAKDSTQDEQIQQIQKELTEVPNAAELEDLRRQLAANDDLDAQQETKISALEDGLQQTASKSEMQSIAEGLNANDRRDDQQEADILQLQRDILSVPTKEALDQLHAEVRTLESNLNANTDLDGEQSKEIQQLKDDLNGLATKAALDTLEGAVTNLGSRVSSNETLDGQQQEDIDKLKEEIKNGPKQSTIDEINLLIKGLQEEIKRLQEDLTATDQIDEGQQGEIDKLWKEITTIWDKIKIIPTDEAIMELTKRINELQASLATNIERDDQQQQDIDDLKVKVEGIPDQSTVEALIKDVQKLQADLQANGQLDTEQQAEIVRLWDAIRTIPTDEAIQELRRLIGSLRTNLNSNTKRDDQQQEEILALQQAILEFASKDSVQNLDEKVSSLESNLNANQLVDEQQQTDIKKLQEDVLNIPTNEAFNQILKKLEALGARVSANEALDIQQGESISDLVNDLSENVETDRQQQIDIDRLKEQVSNIPTDDNLEELRQQITRLKDDLEANDQLDEEQQKAIKELQDEFTGIPTKAALEELKLKIQAAQEDVVEAERKINRQAGDIRSLNEWRTSAIQSLEEIKRQLGELDDELDVEQIKAEVLAELKTITDGLASRVTDLEDLPSKLDELEEKVNGIKEGIDEATATQIAATKVQELRDSLDGRFAEIEEKTDQVAGLIDRMQKAEEDIEKLFELVKDNPPGNGQGDVTKVYVQTELRKLEKKLSDLITDLRNDLNTLLGLPDVVQNIEERLAKATTLEQVSALIQAAVDGLVNAQDLIDLEGRLDARREELRTAIQEAYTAYVEDKFSELDGKINATKTELEGTLRQILEEKLAQIWQELPDQELPENWLETILEKVVELDADTLAKAEELDGQLKTELLKALGDKEAGILADIAELYATKQELGNQRAALVKEIKDQIDTFAGTLEIPLSEEEVRAIAIEEATKLVAGIDQRLQALEEKTYEARISMLEDYREKLEDLKLGTFKSFVLNLDLPRLRDLVHELEVFKASAAPKLTQLETDLQDFREDIEKDIQELRDDFENSPVSDVATRLARVCLMGWGIVGGLELHTDEEFCLHLSPGEGITPDGQIVRIEKPKSFLGYQMLTDEEKAELEYDWLLEVPVWKLIEVEKKDTVDGVYRRWLTPQTNRERDIPFCLDKVVLVLPDHLSDQNYFLTITMDDYLKLTASRRLTRQIMGAERDFEHADYLFQPSFSPADNLPSDDILYRAFHPALNLATIHLHRFGFRPGDDCTIAELDETEFPSSLTSLQSLYENWKPIIDDALKSVNDQIDRLITEYHPVLFPQLPVSNFRNTLQILLTNWKAYTQFVERNEGQIEKCFVQYFYDWARDLINGYHECRDELQQLMAQLCLQSRDAFDTRNQHLSLGVAFRPDQDGLAAPLRDPFRQPPIYNGNASRWERTRLYYRRLFELIESFYLESPIEGDNRPAIPQERLPARFRSEEEDPFSPDFTKLKITPGRNLGTSLGLQAIPFYYPLTDGAGSLQYYWDYHHTKTRVYDQHLSYHASDGYDSYNDPDDWHITRPLYYNLDQYDFYRIEGHIGKAEMMIDGIKFNQPVNELSKSTFDRSIVGAIKYLIYKHNLDVNVIGKKIAADSDLVEAHDILTGGDPATHTIYSFITDLMGAEHLGGVPKGGTFIVIVDENDIAIADFAVPYRISISPEQEEPGP